MSMSLESGLRAVPVRRDPGAANAHAVSVTLASAAPDALLTRAGRPPFVASL